MARPQHDKPLAASLGLYRVADPGERLAGVLPQAAWRLDASPRTGADEVRIRVDRLNLDAASYRQLRDCADGDGAAIREAVREIIASRGKMHNPVTGSGGMLTGIVDEVGPDSPLDLKPGDRVATLVSLTLTPLEIYDDLAGWDGLSEQIPCDGHAILFARSIAAVLPSDLPVPLALAVMDVCGAPALTRRVVEGWRWGLGEDFLRQSFRTPQKISPEAPAASTAEEPAAFGAGPVVAILGAAGKSGSLSAAAARAAGASRVIGVVPN
jgi:L-erythro-3,5-diaminohexanoate dehydrogenase